MGTFFSDTMALTRRWLLHLRRQPMMLFFGAMQPIMWLLLFGSLFKNIITDETVEKFGTDDYLTFQTAGVVVMTVLSNAFMGGIPILFDRETGFLDKLLVAPISRAALFTSRFVYVVIFSLGQVALILGIAWLMGVSVAGGIVGLLQILAYSALLAVAFTMFSLGLAFVFKHHAAYFAISGFMITPCIFVSSALVPFSMMPGWMEWAAKANPLTHAIEPVRAAMIEGYAAKLGTNILHDAIFLIVFDIIAVLWGLRILRRAVD